ncbi:PREDICTED: kappa-casein [Myotis brandtii]|nr:PREDICTED: kappa-casein [Myotis brandtii]
MKRFFLILNILAFILPFLGAEVQNQEQQTCCETDKRLFDQSTVKYIPIHYVWKSYPRIAPNYHQYRPAVPINNQYMPYPYYTKPVSIRPHAQIPQWQALPNIYPPTLVRHPYLHPSLFAIPPKKNQDKAVIPTANTVPADEPTLIPPSESTPPLIAIPPKKNQDKAVIPIVNTVPADEPTLFPPSESTPPLIAIPPKKNQDKAVIPTINIIAADEPTVILSSEPTVSTVVTQEASSQFITSTPETTTVTITAPTTVV